MTAEIEEFVQKVPFNSSSLITPGTVFLTDVSNFLRKYIEETLQKP